MKLNSVLAAIGIAAPLLAACSSDQVASFKSSLQQITDRANGQQLQVADAGAPGQQGPSVKDTPLYNLYANKPYDTTKPFTGQYPRVALTILAAPPTHAALTAGAGGAPPGCWTLHAKLWTNAQQSRDVGPFQWCMPRDLPSNTTTSYGNYNLMNTGLSRFGGIARWIPGALAHSMTDTTGNRRTEGPVPPDNPVPTDPATRRYYGNNFQIPSVDAGDGAMFESMLDVMDFDTSINADRRVWIVKFVPASGP